MVREGLRHEGTLLRFGGQTHRIDFPSLTGGKSVTVYGQQEVVKDLIQARLESGAALHFEAQGLRVSNLTEQPKIHYLEHGEERTLHCDYIAGTDGFHGICSEAIPKGVLKVFERTYPFAWLGILAKAPPSSHELIYANHERGFALHSMRSPSITRNYLQVPPDENLEHWLDRRIWSELQQRLETSQGFELVTGEIFEKGITPMRSFVVEPMQYGRMFLAGDAAHIVHKSCFKWLNYLLLLHKIVAHEYSIWLLNL